MIRAVLAVPAVLTAALIGLEATNHDGYRPDAGDLLTAALTWAAVVAVVPAYLTGAALRTTSRPGAALSTASRRGAGSSAGAAVRLLVAVAGVAVLATAALVVANDLLYRYLVPLPGDLREPLALWPAAGYPVAAALLGGAAGLLRARFIPAGAASPPGRPGHGTRVGGLSRRGRVVAAGALLALAGAFAVPEYTRIALELATERFADNRGVPLERSSGTPRLFPAALGGPPAGLTAGRYALYGYYGSTRSDCPLTDSAGRRIDVVPPAVPFTDNGDGIVTAMLGTFTLDEPAEITGECRSDDFWVAGPPVIKGPLGRAPATPPGVLSVLGALPGVLVISLFLVRVRKKSGSASNPGHQPNG